jgi:hypothetical protein
VFANSASHYATLHQLVSHSIAKLKLTMNSMRTAKTKYMKVYGGTSMNMILRKVV